MLRATIQDKLSSLVLFVLFFSILQSLLSINSTPRVSPGGRQSKDVHMLIPQSVTMLVSHGKGEFTLLGNKVASQLT